MESALYEIFTLVDEVSEISLVRCAHSFDFRHDTNSCENPVRAHFPWSNLYIFHPHQVVWYQNFLFHFPTDAIPQFIEPFICFILILIRFPEALIRPYLVSLFQLRLGWWWDFHSRQKSLGAELSNMASHRANYSLPTSFNIAETLGLSSD